MSLTVIDAYMAGAGNSDLALILGSTQYKGSLDALTSTSGKAPTIVDAGLASTSPDGLVLACRVSGTGALGIYRWNGSSYASMTITGGSPSTSGGAWEGSCVSTDGVWVAIAYTIANAIYIYKYDGSGYTLTNSFAAGYATIAVTFSPDGTKLACNGGGSSNYACRLYSFNSSTGALALITTSGTTGDGHKTLDWVGNYILQSWSSGVTRGAILNATTLAFICYLPATGAVSSARWNAAGTYVYYTESSSIYSASFNGSSCSVVNTYTASAYLVNTDVVISKSRDYILFMASSGVNYYYSVNDGVLTSLTAPTPNSAAAIFTGLL